MVNDIASITVYICARGGIQPGTSQQQLIKVGSTATSIKLSILFPWVCATVCYVAPKNEENSTQGDKYAPLTIRTIRFFP